MLSVLSIVFFSLTILSIYHFGIEQGFISESLVCNLNTKIEDLDKDTILKELSKQPISCKDINFKILGLSLATINIFISLILTIITFKLFLNYEKNK
jgi:disulfide bond formation protein DsbB